jgi:hypothetical protein
MRGAFKNRVYYKCKNSNNKVIDIGVIYVIFWVKIILT